MGALLGRDARDVGQSAARAFMRAGGYLAAAASYGGRRGFDESGVGELYEDDGWSDRYAYEPPHYTDDNDAADDPKTSWNGIEPPRAWGAHSSRIKLAWRYGWPYQLRLAIGPSRGCLFRQVAGDANQPRVALDQSRASKAQCRRVGADGHNITSASPERRRRCWARGGLFSTAFRRHSVQHCSWTRLRSRAPPVSRYAHHLSQSCL